MHLDPILVLRDGSASGDVILLRTFEDIKAYLGANRACARTGIVKSLVKADSPTQKRLAIREFERWARLTELLVKSVPADQIDGPRDDRRDAE